MYSDQELERFYFEYLTESTIRRISLQEFCSKKGVPLKLMERWLRDVHNSKKMPEEASGSTENDTSANAPKKTLDIPPAMRNYCEEMGMDWDKINLLIERMIIETHKKDHLLKQDDEEIKKLKAQYVKLKEKESKLKDKYAQYAKLEEERDNLKARREELRKQLKWLSSFEDDDIESASDLDYSLSKVKKKQEIVSYIDNELSKLLNDSEKNERQFKQLKKEIAKLRSK